MPTRASSRHSASLPGVTPSSRLRASSVSPRKMRADDLGLAAARPSHLVGSVAFAGSARASRSHRRRRRLDSWLLHGVVHCALESQMGVHGSCGSPAGGADGRGVQPGADVEAASGVRRCGAGSAGTRTRERGAEVAAGTCGFEWERGEARSGLGHFSVPLDRERSKCRSIGDLVRPA
jgi:hypothetical protein